MSNRPRGNDTRAEVYDTGTTKGRTTTTPNVDVENTIVTPTDRVRWGSIIAGIFAALSTLLVLSLLGLAFGAAKFDAGDTGRSFGIGSGIWAAISTLLAFLVGGYVAARTAAVRGRSNGLLNGTMVWVVAIPLLVYALSSGISSLLGAAARTAGTAAAAVAPAAGQAADNPAAQQTAAVAGQAVQQTAAAAVQNLQQQVQNPQTQEDIARGVRNGALGALVPLLLGLAASAAGGALGARREEDHTTVRQTA